MKIYKINFSGFAYVKDESEQCSEDEIMDKFWREEDSWRNMGIDSVEESSEIQITLDMSAIADE